MNVSECSNVLTLYNKHQQLKSSYTSDVRNCCAESVCIQPENKKELSTSKKIGIGCCSVLGVATSLALLAKFSAKKSLNPKTIIKNGWKNSYYRNAKFKSGSIITMVAGSILGGLAGGAIFDKDEKFSSKKKEGITQFLNASVPIVFVEGMTTIANKFSQSVMPAWYNSKNIMQKAVSKFPAAIGALGALFVGVLCANKISGKINEKVYNEKTDRNVKLTDFMVHVDDIGVASTFVLDEKNPVTKLIQKCIPVAMCIPGYEVGTAKAKNISTEP